MGTESRRVRAIAFYLPQFHPIPENDSWWGTGFTEWTNVAKARPLYRGHWQPRLPADLGFYDLRVPETRARQAALAREAGIEGFCYWHYWFGAGRRILERPFQEVLQSGEPDFPFCLAWANQSWTGVWYGNPDRVLVKQEYPGEDDERMHFEAVLPAFLDPRYMRVDGKPIFLVCVPGDMPSSTRFVEHWRRLATRAGLPGIFFIACSPEHRHPMLRPFDAVTSTSPGDYLSGLKDLPRRVKRRLRRRDFGSTINNFSRHRFLLPARFSYADAVQRAFAELPDDPRFLPCVFPNWDNSPRSGKQGVVFEGSTPELFAEYVRKAIELLKERDQTKRILFLKAWNEWAEGNYLEPDLKFGRSFLEALKTEIYPSGDSELGCGAGERAPQLDQRGTREPASDEHDVIRLQRRA